jgi:lipopolysaccharide/colanic/teichoic acid biosynthesis glycosyltransferase
LPAWKRTVDVTCCIVVLPVLGVLTFFVACVSAVTSKGPIFFRQEKVGLMGERIRLYRFRTMKMRPARGPAELSGARTEEDEPSVATQVTRRKDVLMPGGRFLRATGLVELPQIVNVLRGEMSIVGPRPLVDDEMDEVEAKPGLRSMPGLTGLWRVSRVNSATAEDASRLDTTYAQQKSIWLDSKIILLTIPALCFDIVSAGKTRAERIRRATSAGTQSIRLSTSRQPW